MNAYELLGWLATALNLWGNWSLTNRNRLGWIVRLACNVSWIAYCIPAEAWPLLANHLAFLVINVRGWIIWSRPKPAPGKAGAE